jgi:type I restriction enzyme S subunit
MTREDWVSCKIEDIYELNPKILDKSKISKDLEIQFLPMKLVEEVANRIHLTETKKFGEVQKKSYTYFANDDILFAKVTPCMENGKISIAS